MWYPILRYILKTLKNGHAFRKEHACTAVRSTPDADHCESNIHVVLYDKNDRFHCCQLLCLPGVIQQLHSIAIMQRFTINTPSRRDVEVRSFPLTANLLCSTDTRKRLCVSPKCEIRHSQESFCDSTRIYFRINLIKLARQSTLRECVIYLMEPTERLAANRTFSAKGFNSSSLSYLALVFIFIHKMFKKIYCSQFVLIFIV